MVGLGRGGGDDGHGGGGGGCAGGARGGAAGEGPPPVRGSSETLPRPRLGRPGGGGGVGVRKKKGVRKKTG